MCKIESKEYGDVMSGRASHFGTMKKKEEEDESFVIVSAINKKSPFSVFWYNYRFIYPDNYPAKMNQDFVRDMIELYTDEGDSVLDPYVGSGTVYLKACELKRIAHGIDINPDAVHLIREHCLISGYPTDNIKLANALQMPYPDNSIKMILTSPPFGLMIDSAQGINYSNEVEDISNSRNYKEFRSKLKQSLREMYRVLVPKGICVIEMRVRSSGGIKPLSAWITVDCEEIGFEVWSLGVYFTVPYTIWPFGKPEARKFLPAHCDILVFRKPIDSKLDEFNK